MAKRTKPATKPPAISEESATLWQLTSDMIDLINEMNEVAEENAGVIPEELDAKFDALGETHEQKVEKCNTGLRVYDSDMANIDAEIARVQAIIDPQIEALKKFRAKHEAGKKRLEDYIQRNFTRLGLKKVTATLGGIRLQDTKDRTNVVDEEAVPDRFKNVTVKMSMEDWRVLCDYALTYEDLREESGALAMLDEDSLDITIKVDKNAAYAARGEDEYVMSGIPGVEFVPGQTLKAF